MEPTVDQYVPSDYLPIIIQFAAALGFVVVTLLVTHMIGPKRKSDVKDAPWESGIESVGDARTPISYKYFMTAILFVLFDVEIIFMYPWAVNFKTFGIDGFIQMLVFMGLLLAGFFYVIKKGILDWE
ncbi:NADH-quinone oxidoreductase subunit A [Pontibacter oryzae]|uniref:NADH-quinone oxidoreductase subunit A n=1 Tax=Pontibacter oryzae TaxID=2304593 RepID=A0A399SMP6_9BACT|nr:NADH-quinone oxidoreductase subunit A [Pontibacter oryzae]RIJ43085.1 NADH-quinone oxidoreductase subunit A [Pontibacter oryzae]